jgi:DNA-binding FrmR family transcriptional regulator
MIFYMQYERAAELIAALHRIEGQARGIERMIETGRPCEEVVRQISAMRNAADRLSHRLVASNLRACLSGAELAPAYKRRVEHGLSALAELRS